MVKGIDKFRKAFKDFSDNYVIIGGTACDVALSGSIMKPRATDDIDMILVVEKMTTEFANAFWRFIKVCLHTRCNVQSSKTALLMVLSS